MVTAKKTYCRICEAHCGLEVTVDGDEIVAVKPDKTHPVSKGFACVKGTSLPELHNDPDRVNFPQKKVAGVWQRIGWGQALSEIGDKVRGLRSRHGNRSIGHYLGNPTAFSAQNALYAASFMQALGSPNTFSSGSIDVNNKFHVSRKVYGLASIQPIPDFERCEFFMCLGSNPVVSQMSVVSVTDALDKLRGIERRGGRVITVDPRRNETARKVGEHLFIRPGTDAYLLLAMLYVLRHELSVSTSRYERYATGLTEFLTIADNWPPERVETITGASAATIRELAMAYGQANGAVLYMSTGVNMGPFGSIAYWLVQGLSLITGNLDAPGGLVFPQGPIDAIRLGQALGLGKDDPHRTLKDGWHREVAAFPSAALADEISIDHPERIRALFVSAGNPVHSIPGNRLVEAFEQLELLVAIDIYPSETAQHADYLLPATDMLERSDYPISHVQFQAEPHAQYTKAMVPAKYERKPEWWIFQQLASACGADLLQPTPMNGLGKLNQWLERFPFVRAIQPDDLIGLLLRVGGKTSLAKLKKNPQGMMLPATRAGQFLGKRVPLPGRKINLAPDTLMADLPRLAVLEAEFTANSDGLRMIGRRERRSHNSWMQNNRRIKHDGGIQALMNPLDAKKRGIEDGDEIEIGEGEQTIRLPVKLTDDVMAGVLCVPHGWGHSSPGLAKASHLPGGNINVAIPDVANHIEPVSGQAIMLGHQVPIRRCASQPENLAV